MNKFHLMKKKNLVESFLALAQNFHFSHCSLSLFPTWKKKDRFIGPTLENSYSF
jgi:hypothetical protein